MANRPVITPTPTTDQNFGGMPEILHKFEVQEHEVTNAPDSNDHWNENMGNPVGPK